MENQQKTALITGGTSGIGKELAKSGKLPWIILKYYDDGRDRKAFNETVTHDSRNVLRDCMGEAGQIDTEMPHAPLLFIAGEEDQIIPYELDRRTAEAYTDEVSIVDFKAFAGRGHWICGQPGWQEVADYISEWLTAHEKHQYHINLATL